MTADAEWRKAVVEQAFNELREAQTAFVAAKSAMAEARVRFRKAARGAAKIERATNAAQKSSGDLEDE